MHASLCLDGQQRRQASLDSLKIGPLNSELALFLALVEEGESRHGLDVVLGGNSLRFIDVDLGKRNALVILALGAFFDFRRNALARSTPVGVEINQNLVVLGEQAFQLFCILDMGNHLVRDSNLVVHNRKMKK